MKRIAEDEELVLEDAAATQKHTNTCFRDAGADAQQHQQHNYNDLCAAPAPAPHQRRNPFSEDAHFCRHNRGNATFISQHEGGAEITAPGSPPQAAGFRSFLAPRIVPESAAAPAAPAAHAANNAVHPPPRKKATRRSTASAFSNTSRFSFRTCFSNAASSSAGDEDSDVVMEDARSTEESPVSSGRCSEGRVDTDEPVGRSRLTSFEVGGGGTNTRTRFSFSAAQFRGNVADMVSERGGRKRGMVGDDGVALSEKGQGGEAHSFERHSRWRTRTTATGGLSAEQPAHVERRMSGEPDAEDDAGETKSNGPAPKRWRAAWTEADLFSGLGVGNNPFRNDAVHRDPSAFADARVEDDEQQQDQDASMMMDGDIHMAMDVDRDDFGNVSPHEHATNRGDVTLGPPGIVGGGMMHTTTTIPWLNRGPKAPRPLSSSFVGMQNLADSSSVGVGRSSARSSFHSRADGGGGAVSSSSSFSTSSSSSWTSKNNPFLFPATKMHNMERRSNNSSRKSSLSSAQQGQGFSINSRPRNTTNAGAVSTDTSSDPNATNREFSSATTTATGTAAFIANNPFRTNSFLVPGAGATTSTQHRYADPTRRGSSFYTAGAFVSAAAPSNCNFLGEDDICMNNSLTSSKGKAPRTPRASAASSSSSIGRLRAQLASSVPVANKHRSRTGTAGGGGVRKNKDFLKAGRNEGSFAFGASTSAASTSVGLPRLRWNAARPRGATTVTRQRSAGGVFGSSSGPSTAAGATSSSSANVSSDSGTTTRTPSPSPAPSDHGHAGGCAESNCRPSYDGSPGPSTSYDGAAGRSGRAAAGRAEGAATNRHDADFPKQCHSERKLETLSIRTLKELLFETHGVEAPTGIEKAELVAMINGTRSFVRRRVSSSSKEAGQAEGGTAGAEAATASRFASARRCLFGAGTRGSTAGDRGRESMPSASQESGFEPRFSQERRVAEVGRILSTPVGRSHEDASWAWGVLGIKAGSGAEDIRKAVKRLRILCHPDKFATVHREEAERAFKRIVEAEAAATRDLKNFSFWQF